MMNVLKLSISGGATESINGYQLGIVGAGSVSASQIKFQVTLKILLLKLV